MASLTLNTVNHEGDKVVKLKHESKARSQMEGARSSSSHYSAKESKVGLTVIVAGKL